MSQNARVMIIVFNQGAETGSLVSVESFCKFVSFNG
jgi:hypothetical protein